MILINASVVSLKHRGMGGFTKNILKVLLLNNDVKFLVVSCTDIDLEIKEIIQKQNIKYIQINTPLPLFEQIIIPFIIVFYKIKVCWFPSNTFPLWKPSMTKYIVTIHDLIFLDKNLKPKNLYQKVGKLYRALNTKWGVKKIDSLTSVSRTMLEDITSKFNIKGDTSVLYNSIDINQEFNEGILRRYDLQDEKFIYTIAGIAPHKNLKFLIKSFKHFRLKFSDFRLVITGVDRKYHHLFVDDNIILTDFISDGEKNSLIKKAEMFVFASKQEGFGIPLIEAMYLNQRVLASDIKIFSEIGNGFVNYFSLNDGDFLYNLFGSSGVVKNNIDEVRCYIEKKFNTEESANKLLSIILTI